MPRVTTENVINELHNLEQNIPNFANHPARIGFATCYSLTSSCCNFLGDMYEGISGLSLHEPPSSISDFFRMGFKTVSSIVFAQKLVSLVLPITITDPNQTQVHPWIGNTFALGGLLNFGVTTTRSVYNRFQQLPARYNNAVIMYNASNINTHITSFAHSYLQHVYTPTKNWCFTNGANTSVQETDKLFQSFREFTRLHNGFNTGPTNDHQAFLYFLYESNRIDDLFVLVKLGADEQDCIGDFESLDALYFARDKMAQHSLLWLAAKEVATQYSLKELKGNHTSSDECEVVESARRYCHT